MSNLSQRLRRLEPAPEHQDYLAEVGRRLMRYGIETRHQVKAGKLPECAWGPEAEEIYQRWTKDARLRIDRARDSRKPELLRRHQCALNTDCRNWNK